MERSGPDRVDGPPTTPTSELPTRPRLASGVGGAHLADVLLVVSLAVLAFLLGCFEMFDQDIWWHLRSGRWILEQGRIPRLDLFTFSSAGRAWIDLHWGFQVAMALAYALGGVPGVILLASSSACAAFVIALMAREREWPLWVAALCWLPALALMGTRFDPRPEVVSLVYLAGFLAVLIRVGRRPALAWALPPIQVLWVNTHSLFILGPIVLGCYLVERGTRAWGAGGLGRGPRPLWRHLAPASVAVALACLANPYGVRGALFPFELFPKIADPGNPYKAYIDEFTGLRKAMLDQMHKPPGVHLHLRLHVFLLLLLPWSFLVPAAWREWRSSPGWSGGHEGGHAVRWAVGLSLACGLAVCGALGVPFPEAPAWLVRAGRALPAVILVAGGCFAAPLSFRSRKAAITTAVGAASVAAWEAWLWAYLFDRGSETPGPIGAAMACAAALLVALAAALVIRSGGSLFRLLLAAALTYLSFQAVRNINLFGLAVGAILAWNLGEWVAALGAGSSPGGPYRAVALGGRGLIIGLVALWAASIVTDRAYQLEGADLHFGLRERPLTYGHDAARFAGRPGLPGRALVFDVGQTGVYIFHDGPDRKVFMDARLEVPDLSTFQTYVRIEDWLNEGDPRWVAAVGRLGDPLILLNHEGETEAEASLLAHPRWRCIYFDAIASVFVPRQGPTSSPSYPDFDFAASRFRSAGEAASPLEPRQAMAEAVALQRIGFVLRKRGADPWRFRIPILIGASDLVRAVLAGGVAGPEPWRLLGLIEWDMVPDLTRPPPRPADAWDPATGLPWARATYCFRRALEAAPDDLPTLRSLADCLGVRRMAEARRDVESLMARTVRTEEIVRFFSASRQPIGPNDWASADRVAAARLHLGDPDTARRVWEAAAAPPSPAMRLARLAGADLAALDPAGAEAQCRKALELDQSLGEAWYVLAAALVESGRAADALTACREGLKRELSPPQRAAILGIERLVGRSIHGSR